jgi:hypothetical protein
MYQDKKQQSKADNNRSRTGKGQKQEQ